MEKHQNGDIELSGGKNSVIHTGLNDNLNV